MLIAITSTGKEINSQMDARFGRAKFIIIYDSDNLSFTAHDNNLNLNANQGAGIQTAQNIIELGATVLITGNCGPKAFRVLEVGGIKIFTAPNLKINDAIKMYQENKLTELTNSNVEGHW
ncbi:MAG: hypothetical protein A2202_05840 [Bdellovibrionales bacterium RIFOXYA1_FULL_36_14]|nr:MAG: hypothetical protein A2202_05840 [Bdellovibrionales bacterium RIFOXYA1_FULL_36_14]